MRIAICEDDKCEAERLKAHLSMLAKQYGVPVTIDVYGSGRSLLFEIEDQEKRPSILYLDISLPGESGIAIAKRIRALDYNIEIIFATMSEAHMLEGFDVSAFHYMVKGKISDRKVEEIFAKACTCVEAKQEEYITFNAAGEAVAVKIQDICYFEVLNRIVTVHYLEYGREKTFDFYTTLKKLENSLCGKGFIRIHKSYLVAEKRIVRVFKKSVLIFNFNSVELPVGRTYLKSLQEFKYAR